MSKKNTFKNIFDEKINKNQIYNEILLKYEGKEKEMKKRNFKYILAPACLILITICGILLISQNNILRPIKNITKNQIYINKIKDINTSLDIAGKGEDITISEVYQFYSKIKDIIIPNDLKNIRNIKKYSKSDITGDYTILDGYNIIYADGEENLKSIEIFMSDTLKEKRRCLSLVDNSYKISYINETKITIISFGNYFIAQFEHKNIYFDIETRNINESELINLLNSIT